MFGNAVGSSLSFSLIILKMFAIKTSLIIEVKVYFCFLKSPVTLSAFEHGHFLQYFVYSWTVIL